MPAIEYMATGVPSARRRRVVPSYSVPFRRFMPKKLSQRSSRPAAQAGQNPQGITNADTTRVPTAGPLTPGPSATTVPEISCPITAGVGNRQLLDLQATRRCVQHRCRHRLGRHPDTIAEARSVGLAARALEGGGAGKSFGDPAPVGGLGTCGKNPTATLLEDERAGQRVVDRDAVLPHVHRA